MIKAILTDLDGVLRSWNNDLLFDLERTLDLEKGFLFSCAFNDQFVLPAIVGDISHEQWIANVVNEMEKVNSHDLVEQLIAQWQDSPSEIDWRLMSEYNIAFPDAFIVLVSNATTRMDQDLKNTGLPEKLNFTINSSEIGLVKPDPEFFKSTLRTIACASDEVLFIDDQIENVNAAIKLGIASFHYQNDLDSLKGFLARFS